MSTDDQREVDKFIIDEEADNSSEYFVRKDFRYQQLRSMTIQFVQARREFLMNTSTKLKLTLWKAQLTESLPDYQNEDTARTTREEMRVIGGQSCQVVFPNVFAFL